MTNPVECPNCFTKLQVRHEKRSFTETEYPNVAFANWKIESCPACGFKREKIDSVLHA